MIFLAYNEKTQFYLTDSFDPQKLYNSARNIEIAAWKLANARDARGEPFLKRVLADKKLFVIGGDDDLGKLVAHRKAEGPRRQ